jgi:hypothetical protein
MFRIRVSVPLVFAFALALVPLHAADTDPISVALRTFKFKTKTPDSPSELLGYSQDEGRLFFYTNGTAESTVKIPADAEFEIVINASCDPAQNERAKFKLTVDGKDVGMETLLTSDDAKDYKLSGGKLTAGDRKIAVEFTNDVYKEGEYDRNFYVYSVMVKKK